ncbi:undecaprenyl-phosphate glucose phosphotransferase [Pseudomonas turukhanskensis]|uniref:GumD protein n=1 Tax=Pseudomonas turukhanskensis TaxID=1806536 RepID=A0A9W6K267_9PSED|nr:undecaprenyl-phosphate glucose phosphotransferase [Pseudomonas turukhanskensis]GLK88111.1 GumD protein [Pseudomonas turukhanskensis]
MTSQHSNLMANRRGLTFWGQWVTAMFLANLVLTALVVMKFGSIPSEYRVLGVLTILGSVPCYAALQVYHKRHRLLSGMGRLLAGWCLLLGAMMTIAFATQTTGVYSREVVFSWAILGFAVQVLSYIPLRMLTRLHSRKLRKDRRSVIVGTGSLAKDLADKLSHPSRVPLIGMIATEKSDPADDNGLPVLGTLSELRDVIERENIRRVYIAVPLGEVQHIENIYIDLLDMSVDVVWIPDFGSMLLLNQSISEIEHMPAIYLNESPISSHPAALFAKEAMERTLAALALLLLSPLMIGIAIAVRRSSPGPILFKQERHGWNGEVIKVWKFRSMRVHAPETVVKQATRGDDRITKVGAFIRRTSLDELPQLFNVVFGEMALVGPRPHAVTHNIYYTDKIRAYMARHRIKPGITGLAQITGHRGETETIDKMQQRVNQDLNYINQWSLWLDVKILIKTPFTLLSKNIY